jgi:hypothetical protein
MKVIFFLIRLFLIYFFLSIVFYILPEFFNIGIPFEQSALILSGSYLISNIILLIFIKGYKLGGKFLLTHTLAAISLKFILYLFLIIIVFFYSKNRSLEFILTFFVIYLSFTLYLLISFVKQLKTKNLESR